MHVYVVIKRSSFISGPHVACLDRALLMTSFMVHDSLPFDETISKTHMKTSDNLSGCEGSGV